MQQPNALEQRVRDLESIVQILLEEVDNLHRALWDEPLPKAILSGASYKDTPTMYARIEPNSMGDVSPVSEE